MRSFLEVELLNADEGMTEFEKIGRLTTLITECRDLRDLSARCIRGRFIEPLRQGNVELFFDSNAKLVGAATWAHVSEEVEKRLLHRHDLMLHPAEWNEGDSLWLIDVLAPHGNLKYVLRKLFSHSLAPASSVRYLRKNRGRTIIKTIARSASSRYLRAEEGSQ